MATKIGKIPIRNEVAGIKGIYREAQEKIKDLLLKINIGDATELGMMQTEKQLNDILGKLNRKVIGWADEAMQIGYEKALGISENRLRILGAERQAGFPDKVHQNSILHYKTLLIQDLVRANASIKPNIATYLYLVRSAQGAIAQIQEFDMRDEGVIGGLLDEAIVEGRSQSYLQSLIRQHFNRQIYERKYININGRNYDLIPYAELCARTRIRRVQSEAVLNSCKEWENDLVKISEHGTITKKCLNYEGITFSLSGEDPDFEYLDEYPPFHPNCMHSMAATSRTAMGMPERSNVA